MTLVISLKTSFAPCIRGRKWVEALVFMVAYMFEGIKEATGEVQFLAEEVDGTLVATVGIVEEGLSINGNAKKFVLNNNVNFDTTGIDELKAKATPFIKHKGTEPCFHAGPVPFFVRSPLNAHPLTLSSPLQGD